MPLTSQRTRVLTFPPGSATLTTPGSITCTSTPAANTTLDSGDVGAGNTGAGAAIEGTTVYALCSNASRLLIYDVTNPAAMSKVGDQTLNSGAFAVNQPLTSAIGVLSSKAYIASYPAAGNVLLGVYDCTNPAAITQSGTFTLGGAGTTNAGPRRVAVFTSGGDTFACVCFNDIINILKVTNPAAIT